MVRNGLLRWYLKKLCRPLTLGIVFFLIATPFMWSCGGGGGEGSTSPDGTPPTVDSNGTIQVNTDPNDPEVAIVTGSAIRDRLIFYGTKDDNGDVIQVQTMQYYLPNEDKPWNIEVDGSGWPTRISTHDGSVYTFTYTDDRLTIACNDREGNLYSEDFPFDIENQLSVNNQDYRVAGEEFAVHPLEESVVTTENVKGFLFTKMINPDNNADLGNFNVDEVIITATNHEGVVPYTRVGKGEYRFTVTHRTADLNVLTQKCEERYRTRSTILSVAGAAAGIMSLLIGAKILAASTFFMWAFGTTGSLWGVLSLAVPVGSWSCEDLLRKGLVDMGVGKQKVDVNALYQEERLHYQVDYDLFDLNDDINIARSFALDFSYPVSPGFISVSTIPANPKIGSSYQISVQAILPQGGSIEWEWARSDEGAADKGQWTNSGENIVVNQTFGPFTGADKETTDVVSCKLYAIENNTKVKRGEFIKAISISGTKSSAKCPEGKWSVKTILTSQYSGECDPSQFFWGDFEILPDGHWVSTRGDIETDETSTWTLNGNQILLEGKPTGYCSRKYYEGTIIDIGSGCSRIEGKVIKKCNYDGPFTLVDCFEADLVTDP